MQNNRTRHYLRNKRLGDEYIQQSEVVLRWFLLKIDYTLSFVEFEYLEDNMWLTNDDIAGKWTNIKETFTYIEIASHASGWFFHTSKETYARSINME